MCTKTNCDFVVLRQRNKFVVRRNHACRDMRLHCRNKFALQLCRAGTATVSPSSLSTPYVPYFFVAHNACILMGANLLPTAPAS